MSLKTQIAKIRAKLNGHEYANEQAVSQGIVVHLLQIMGWSTNETDKVCPQYSVSGGSVSGGSVARGVVDFALCVTPNEPVIFIEVKQPGGIDDADKQLFEYVFKQSFHGSVEVAIATDGREWRFYWPSGSGNYERRRFCVVDLVEHDAKKAAANLQRYLSWESVRSNQALRNAKNDYEALRNKRDAMEHIPNACEKLLAENREVVIRAVSEKVETLCGYTPADEQINELLETLTFEARAESDSDGVVSSGGTTPGRQTPPQPQGGANTKIKVIFPNGDEIFGKNVAATFVDALRKIGFAKAARVNLMATGHPIISREQYDLTWKDVGGGFFVRTHSGTAKKVKQLKTISRQLNLDLEIQTC